MILLAFLPLASSACFAIATLLAIQDGCMSFASAAVDLAAAGFRAAAGALLADLGSVAAGLCAADEAIT